MPLIQRFSSMLWIVLLILPHPQVEPSSQLKGPLMVSNLQRHMLAPSAASPMTSGRFFARDRHLGNLPHVSMLQMDAEHLTFPDASFDVVLCGFAIFLFPHLEQVHLKHISERHQR